MTVVKKFLWGVLLLLATLSVGVIVANIINGTPTSPHAPSESAPVCMKKADGDYVIVYDSSVQDDWEANARCHP